MFVKISILLILTAVRASISEAFIYGIENLENSVAEKCVTKNNEVGYCQEFFKCKSAQQLYSSGRFKEITICNVMGNIPFVCCPSKKSIPPTKPSTPHPTKSTTPQPKKPTKKSSTKFQNALCKNIQPKLKIDYHVIDGEKAGQLEFPFQVALGYKSENGNELDFNCGGSLIADDVVLTAAHCVNRKHIVPVMVRLGRTSLDLDDEDDESVVQDIEIDTIRMHPKYSRIARQNDIALIKLKNPVVPSDSVDTICLSTSDNIPEDEFTITGFGRTNIINSKKSDWLLKGKVSNYPLEDCKEIFGIFGVKIVDSQLCAKSDKGVDTCQGDSGGPLFYEHGNNYYLQGIASFGNSCGGDYPAIYTKVNKFFDWIEAVMADFES